MGAENNDFSQLRVLLSLKRHEQPPPRFFEEFASRVAARIQAPDEPEASGSVFSRWFESLGLGPVPACACALIACGAVLYSVASSLAPEPAGALTATDPVSSLAQAREEAVLIPARSSYAEPSGMSVSNPVTQAGGFMFPVTRASYTPGRP